MICQWTCSSMLIILYCVCCEYISSTMAVDSSKEPGSHKKLYLPSIFGYSIESLKSH